MRPYLEALDEKMRPRFTAEVLEKVRKEYKKQDDGRILLKFPRLFFIAKKN
jgi:trans-aconitate 2-methyltransferase